MAAVLTEESSDNNSRSSQYNKVVELGQLTLKVVILINGAAAIAILALIGSILSSGVESTVIPYLAWSIASFGIGVLSGSIAVGMGYLSEYYDYQFKLHSNSALTEELSLELKKHNDKIVEVSLNFRSKRFIAAYRLVNCSFIFFGIGIVLCALAFLV